MPAGVQPANRKLLDDVTAGAQVTQPATPLGAALAATYVPVTQKGAASGVASLGVDGKVPAAQLPPAAAPPILSAYKAASTTRTNTTAQTADPDLVLTLTTGTYWIEVELSLNTGGTNGVGHAFGGTSAWTCPTNAGHQSYTVAGSTTAFVQTWVQNVQNYAVSFAGAAAGPSRVSFPAVVTTAGTLTFVWGPTTSTATATQVLAGSRIRALKVA